MNAITQSLTGATALFASLAVLAVTVVGFFLGRKWLSKASDPETWSAEERYEHHLRTGWTSKAYREAEKSQ